MPAKYYSLSECILFREAGSATCFLAELVLPWRRARDGCSGVLLSVSCVCAAALVEADVPVVLFRAAEKLVDSEEALACCGGEMGKDGDFALAHRDAHIVLKTGTTAFEHS